ncbi:hypothetical protein DRP05_05855 [Archaeoglobales archaeon]|nr:MAG: hypothetical protein DRP05_05855 [Archaeoglobales archaeon]
MGKRDAIAADAILQAAYNISREEVVVSFRNVAKHVLDIFRATLSNSTKFLILLTNKNHNNLILPKSEGNNKENLKLALHLFL